MTSISEPFAILLSKNETMGRSSEGRTCGLRADASAERMKQPAQAILGYVVGEGHDLLDGAAVQKSRALLRTDHRRDIVLAEKQTTAERITFLPRLDQYTPSAATFRDATNGGCTCIVRNVTGAHDSSMFDPVRSRGNPCADRKMRRRCCCFVV
jgi:hypothetical protein